MKQEVLEKDEIFEALLEKRERDKKMEAVKLALLRGDRDGLVISLSEVIHNYPAHIVEMILDLPYFDHSEKGQEAAEELKLGFSSIMAYESSHAQESVLELVMSILDGFAEGLEEKAGRISKFCGDWRRRGVRGLKKLFSFFAGKNKQDGGDCDIANDIKVDIDIVVVSAAAPDRAKPAAHPAAPKAPAPQPKGAC